MKWTPAALLGLLTTLLSFAYQRVGFETAQRGLPLAYHIQSGGLLGYETTVYHWLPLALDALIWAAVWWGILTLIRRRRGAML